MRCGPRWCSAIDKYLDETRRKRFHEETKQEIVGAINTGGFALLEGGMKIEIDQHQAGGCAAPGDREGSASKRSAGGLVSNP